MLKRLCLLAALAASTATAQDRPVVATVNYPLAWMAERLGGGAVDVLFPVPNGVDPSFWRPGLSDIAAIQQADVIALNGAGFAPWTARSSLPRSRIVDTSAGFSDAYISTESVTHSHGGDGEHSHEGIANYTWLDFAQAAQQAEALAAMMQRRIPDLSDTLAETLPALQADLANLDAEASAAASTTQRPDHPRHPSPLPILRPRLWSRHHCAGVGGGRHAVRGTVGRANRQSCVNRGIHADLGGHAACGSTGHDGRHWADVSHPASDGQPPARNGFSNGNAATNRGSRFSKYPTLNVLAVLAATLRLVSSFRPTNDVRKHVS